MFLSSYHPIGSVWLPIALLAPVVPNALGTPYNNYCSGTAWVLLWYWLGTAFTITKLQPSGKEAEVGYEPRQTVTEEITSMLQPVDPKTQAKYG